MKNIVFGLLFTVLQPLSLALAEVSDRRGTADYAMMHPEWPCAAARESEKGLETLNKAILWNTFGTSTACLEEYLNDARLKNIQIHLINEVCQRNNVCGDYEFLHGMSVEEYNQKLVQRDPVLLEDLRGYMNGVANFLKPKLKPGTTCYISPGLESNLNMKGARVLMEVTGEIFPFCKLVWNPAGINKRGRPMPDIHFEVHGSEAKLSAPCIADLDGEDISFPSRPAILPNFMESSEIPAYFERYAACDMQLLWIAEHNGLKKGAFIDPRARKNFPSVDTFNLLREALLTGAAPADTQRGREPAKENSAQ